MALFTWVFIILAALILYAVMVYNGLVSLKNRVKEGWSDIEVQLKRRYDLIPNVVSSVKGYAQQEKDVLLKVTEARANALNAHGMAEQGQAENMLSGALKSLFAVAENYPDLKSNQNFLQLQNELVDTEDKIQASRRFYNNTVKDLNTRIEQFPSNLLAQLFKFKQEAFFEIPNGAERENIKVSFEAKEETKPQAAASENQKK